MLFIILNSEDIISMISVTLVSSVALIIVLLLLDFSLQEFFWPRSILQYDCFVGSTNIVFDVSCDFLNNLDA